MSKKDSDFLKKEIHYKTSRNQPGLVAIFWNKLVKIVLFRVVQPPCSLVSTDHLIGR